MTTKLFTALDFDNEKKAWDFFQQLHPLNPYFKIGLELYAHAGPKFVEKIVSAGAKVFLDLKFHDIPNTVAAALSQVAGLGVGWVNIHLVGGEVMVKKSKEALTKHKNPPVLLGVTVLTSMNSEGLQTIGISDSPEQYVLRLAKLGKQWGVDGIVCSAQELKPIRNQLGDKFITVVPGIRLAGGEAHDQVRVATPRLAANDGANFIVIGRPITQAKDPIATVESILTELNVP